MITLLAVTGLTHRQAYKDIIRHHRDQTLAVLFIIAVSEFVKIPMERRKNEDDPFLGTAIVQ